MAADRGHLAPPIPSEERITTPEFPRGLSIPELDDWGGHQALRTELNLRLGELELSSEARSQILGVADFMTYLHSGDKRSDGDGTYAGHFYRVTLKGMDCGITDPASIKAWLAHDSVEDHALEVVLFLNSFSLDPIDEKEIRQWDEGRLRDAAIGYYAADESFGPEAARKVEQLTCPVVSDSACKQAQYEAHLEELRREDPESFVMKIMDAWDNFVLNFRTRSRKRQYKSDCKYYRRPAELYIEALSSSELPLEEHVRLGLLDEFIAARERAVQRILVHDSRAILAHLSLKADPECIIDIGV